MQSSYKLNPTGENNQMKKEQGFSLIELLIVVAIIAIIAAIAVPSMLTARMAANEAGAIQGCRTIGSAQMAFAAVNNQTFAELDDLADANFLDMRFHSDNGGFNGYTYAEGEVTNATPFTDDIAGFLATPIDGGSSGRYLYGVGADQVVRYMGEDGTGTTPAKCGTADCDPGDPIGINKDS
jgi:prepilin-type N-terminal cleavage/methylation domain-containing protein